MITYFSYISLIIIATLTAPYEKFYGCICRSTVGWFEVGEATLIRTNSVHKSMEKFHFIRDKLQTTQSHRESYGNVRRIDLEFEIDDSIL